MRSPCPRTPPTIWRRYGRRLAWGFQAAACSGRGVYTRSDRQLRRASRRRGGATKFRFTGLAAYSGEMTAVDPRPLLGEPLPLDLLNTTWMSGDALQDLLVDEAGARIFLDGHGFDAPADAAARRALRETREALRALLSDPSSATARSWRECRAGAGRAAAAARPRRRRARSRRFGQLACAVDLRGGDGEAAREPRGSDPRLRQPGLRPVVPGTSRPGTRRWCSMAACGNRDKAIRHGRTAGHQ